jgi:hypothetical protein
MQNVERDENVVQLIGGLAAQFPTILQKEDMGAPLLMVEARLWSECPFFSL